eukprot:TRINITY_DN56232_c0_g1_i1.p1 TRINITY_DN56232_c0_g1~~TRINITY_DN56232_c0_g1_i1.p1  ORF type:complete len:669 (+),score=82.34 TRINITY_DN56232_c0_g1_i1:76-2082(+)
MQKFRFPLASAANGTSGGVGGLPSALEVAAGVEVDPQAAHRRTSWAFAKMCQLTWENRVSMEWRNIGWSVNGKIILRNITGMMDSGRVTAVLGPSGSGKSSLLNLLAGRYTRGPDGDAPVRGTVSINGIEVEDYERKRNIAYVMQDDCLLLTQTPRECIKFSASLRRPGSSREHDALVTQMLETLGLTKCADTMVGSEVSKGISGGERKKTSVGAELVTSPTMLFVDEPFSGLDSYAAFCLAKILKDIAEAGMPVLISVYRPSSEIFAMLDDVIFLHDGQCVYHGHVDGISPYFNRWKPCPPNFSPADHIMFLLQKDAAECIGGITEMKTAWRTSELFRTLEQRMGGATSPAVVGRIEGRTQGSRGGFGIELRVLFLRELRGTLRNKGAWVARLGMSFFFGVFYALLFFGSASSGDDPNVPGSCLTNNFDQRICIDAYLAHYGLLVSLSIAAMIGSAQHVLLTFPSERPIFLREFTSRQYGVVPYFISKTLVEMPVIFLCQLMIYLISYQAMGLHGNFWVLVLISWGLGMASSSLCLVTCCAASSARSATQLSLLVLIPQMLFSGLFLPVEEIPFILRSMKWYCPLKYAINLLVITEFDYVRRTLDSCAVTMSQGQCHRELPGFQWREASIRHQGVKWKDQKSDAFMLTGLAVGFRVISTAILWRKRG